MAKITFVHDEVRDRIGVMALSASLKEKGHKTQVRCNMGEKDIINSVLETKPDIVGLSTCTVEHKFALNFAKQFKAAAPSIPILMGGPHATFFPEVLSDPNIDLICRGEADYAVVELLGCIDEGRSYKNLDNFHVKIDNKITKNPVRPFFEEIDKLPYPDREIYYSRYPKLSENPTKTFMGMRGCPFQCTYCFNHAMIELYKGKGKYVRWRRPENFVGEIKKVKDKYGLRWVQLNDDTLNLDRKWLYSFLDIYKKEIGVPFICNVRVDCLDEEMVIKLKEAGCDRANFAIEHGNAKMRNVLLKRKITDEQIINAGKWFAKYKIRVYVTNITGFPGETISDFFDTVKLNRKVRSEWAACFLLQPFPGTKIYDYAKENGYLDDNFTLDDLEHPHSCFFSNRKSGSAIRQENIKDLEKYQKYFHYLVKFPVLTPLIKLLVKFPQNKMNDFLYQLPNYRKYIKYAKDNRERWNYIVKLFRTFTR